MHGRIKVILRRVAIPIVLVLLVAGTFAWFTRTDIFINIFEMGVEGPAAILTEEHWIEPNEARLDAVLPKDPFVENTGTEVLVVRVKVLERWTHRPGTIEHILPSYNDLYVTYGHNNNQFDNIHTFFSDANGNWVKGKTWPTGTDAYGVDFGYLYYTLALLPYEKTTKMFEYIHILSETELRDLATARGLNADEEIKRIVASNLDLQLKLEFLQLDRKESIQKYWGDDLPEGLVWNQ